jgi:[ribosomal protein S18]-alanine N-acetyltransferase
MHIRTATLADLDPIDHLEKLSFPHPGELYSRRKLTALIRNRRAEVIVAEIDVDVVGWAAGLVGLEGREKSGRVFSLAVHPSRRGLQLGGRLLDRMLELLRSRGCSTVYLEVREDNVAAIRLYRRFGFVTCAELPGFYGIGVNAVRMKQEMPG